MWVFIAQLEEYCSAIPEAMGSKPVEALNLQKHVTSMSCRLSVTGQPDTSVWQVSTDHNMDV